MSNSVLHCHCVAVPTKAAVVKRIVIHKCTSVRCLWTYACRRSYFDRMNVEIFQRHMTRSMNVSRKPYAHRTHAGTKRLTCKINGFSLARSLLFFRRSMQAPWLFQAKFIFCNRTSHGNALFCCCQSANAGWKRAQRRAQSITAPNIFRLPLWYYNQPNISVFCSQFYVPHMFFFLPFVACAGLFTIRFVGMCASSSRMC